MLQFKSKDDLQQLPPDDPAYPLIADLVQKLIVGFADEGWNYDPEAHGWLVLWEQTDGNRPVSEIWDDNTRLTDLLWEGWTQQDDHYIGVFLANNEWGLCVVVPDEPWIDPHLRHCIEETLDPPIETKKAEA